MTDEDGAFVGVKDAIVDTDFDIYYYSSGKYVKFDTLKGQKLYPLSIDEAQKLPENVRKCAYSAETTNSSWWLRSPGDSEQNSVVRAAYVECNSGTVNASGGEVTWNSYVRPALRLDLTSVVLSSESKKFFLRQSITADNVTATYGDMDKSISATVTKPASGSGTISYAVKSGSEDYISVNATTGEITIKKVPTDGKAYVTVTAEASGLYGKTNKEVVVTINKISTIPNKPDTITVDGKKYEVTEISSEALKNSSATSVIIGKNVTTLASNAFKGSKVKTITIKSKKLTKKSVRNAFKGLKVKKLIVKVKVGSKKENKKYIKKYKKFFIKKNIGVKAVVK